jgi:ketosteroid isomerase-like protein
MPNLRTSMALLGAAALSVSACQKYEGDKGNATAAMADTGAAADAIKADEKAWNEQFKAKDLEKLVGRYASDATAVFPGMAAVSGDGVRKTYEDALKDANFDVSFSSDKIETSGDLAYSRGHFTEKHSDPATKQAVSTSGSYITVYKKQADGSWKVVEDFTAAEPAAAPAAAAPGQ